MFFIDILHINEKLLQPCWSKNIEHTGAMGRAIAPGKCTVFRNMDNRSFGGIYRAVFKLESYFPLQYIGCL